MPTSAIIGSGPNGLSAGIVLAAAGLTPTVFERNLESAVRVLLQRPPYRIFDRIWVLQPIR
jgi:NADPH-dependent glutamate synthase beta subunit-like oxidoreductase